MEQTYTALLESYWPFEALYTLKYAHIDTTIQSLVGNSRLIALPMGILTCDRQTLELTLEPSNYKSTTLLTKPQLPNMSYFRHMAQTPRRINRTELYLFCVSLCYQK